MKFEHYFLVISAVFFTLNFNTINAANINLPSLSHNKPEPVEKDWRIALLRASAVPLKGGIKLASSHLEHFQFNLNTKQSQIMENVLSPFVWNETLLNVSLNALANELPNTDKLPENLPYWKVKDKSVIVIPIISTGKHGLSAGFMSVDKNDKSIVDIYYFYSSDTPGLGQEVLNDNFGKRFSHIAIVNEQGNFAIGLNTKETENNETIAKIDGISGATITSTGVINAIDYWYKVYSPLFN